MGTLQAQAQAQAQALDREDHLGQAWALPEDVVQAHAWAVVGWAQADPWVHTRPDLVPLVGP